MGGSDKHDEAERRAQAFLDDAYALETQADALAFYDRWADEYDAQVERGLHYLAPRLLAEALVRHQPPGDSPILDVGCGTGLTGGCLRELGFSIIDGVDLSKAMLAKAAEKGVYRDLIEADLNDPLPFEDGAYVAAVSTGTFTLGHVGPEPVDELLRVLEAGGIFACTVHLAVWESKGFSRRFAELEDAGAMRIIEQDIGYYFEGSEPTARYCVLRKSS